MAASAREVQNLATTVVAIQGFPVSPAAPAVGDVMMWNGSQWVPTVPAAVTGFLPLTGGTLSGNLTMGAGTTLFAPQIDGGTSGLAINASTAITGNLSLNNPGATLTIFDGNSSGFNWGISSTNGFLVFSSSNVFNVMRLDGSGNNLQVSGVGYQPGGGPWADSSDARIKDIEGDYGRGLAEVLALQPKFYRFKGNDGDWHQGVKDKLFVGLIAQDVEGQFPEMVTQSEGTIDGREVHDLRVLDTGPLIYALVNAVKELAAKIEALG